MARMAGGPTRIDHLRAAWRSLLEAHPHDTLCGTSIDDVAAAADVRMRSAFLQAESLAMTAIEALIGHNASAVREESVPARDLIVIENGAAHPRGGVAIVEYVEKLADEPVGPGSGGGPRIAAIRDSAGDGTALPKGVQLLSSRIGRSRIEAPRHYPDNDIARISTVATYVGAQAGMSLSASEEIPRESARTSTVRVGRDGIQCGNRRPAPRGSSGQGRSVYAIHRAAAWHSPDDEAAHFTSRTARWRARSELGLRDARRKTRRSVG